MVLDDFVGKVIESVDVSILVFRHCRTSACGIWSEFILP